MMNECQLGIGAPTPLCISLAGLFSTYDYPRFGEDVIQVCFVLYFLHHLPFVLFQIFYIHHATDDHDVFGS